LEASELDQLVAQIGEEILSRIGGARLSKAEGLNIPELVCPGCTQRCPQTCAVKTAEIVRAGADRVSASDRMTRVDQKIAVMIDHTILRADATRHDVLRVLRGGEEV
jgi:hypothetical protein